MYLDPPYAPVDSKSFVAYNKEGFGLKEHQELFRLIKESKGRFLLSNVEAGLVLEAFDCFTIEIVSCRRAINSKKPGGRVNEVLITN
jgi:DNA adenine methylase